MVGHLHGNSTGKTTICTKTGQSIKGFGLRAVLRFREAWSKNSAIMLGESVTVRSQLLAVLRAEMEGTGMFIPPSDSNQVLALLGDESYPRKSVPRDLESEEIGDSDDETESDREGNKGAETAEERERPVAENDLGSALDNILAAVQGFSANFKKLESRIAAVEKGPRNTGSKAPIDLASLIEARSGGRVKVRARTASPENSSDESEEVVEVRKTKPRTKRNTEAKPSKLAEKKKNKKKKRKNCQIRIPNWTRLRVKVSHQSRHVQKISGRCSRRCLSGLQN